ncbi:hypothetical protein E3A20_28950, partial [Planctomyces bekefii]
PFHFSSDNLNQDAVAVDQIEMFQKSVLSQVHRFLEIGLPPRAMRFAQELSQFYLTGAHWTAASAYQLPIH